MSKKCVHKSPEMQDLRAHYVQDMTLYPTPANHPPMTFPARHVRQSLRSESKRGHRGF
ncbi:hypothetical protein AGR7B_pAt0108 [Agrobacterium deltaense RV3]|nr:hypothetical protein AGR7B_pAt0108 [Agrobacterium deltaense RV3]